MDTLSMAHARQVIHCDIKPENIVCSPEGRIEEPLVIDWGLATIDGSGTAAGFRGTPGFASVSALCWNGQKFDTHVYPS